MYRLYWEALSGAVAPEVMLEEIAAPYERIPVDMSVGHHRLPEYLALNPTGQIPALALPDGTVIGESAAIALVLGERHPEAGLLPQPGEPSRPVFLRWLMFMATSTYMTFVRVNHPERFTTDPAASGAVRDAALHALADQFRILGEHIKGDPWFLGGGYSVLDIYLAMLIDWHPDRGGMLAGERNLERLYDAVRQRPAFDRVIERHRVA